MSFIMTILQTMLSSSIDRVYLQIDKVVVVLLLVLAVMIQRLKLET